MGQGVQFWTLSHVRTTFPRRHTFTQWKRRCGPENTHSIFDIFFLFIHFFITNMLERPIKKFGNLIYFLLMFSQIWHALHLADSDFLYLPVEVSIKRQIIFTTDIARKVECVKPIYEWLYTTSFSNKDYPNPSLGVQAPGSHQQCQYLLQQQKMHQFHLCIDI